ncbi:bifunctional histidinol-phosphatase/imidazoleglycerol-phosphate dehydratase HisB [Buchnera aphidicola]|uniref:bifunctional histidinol-phosphatase/imidazoleglycerol-phosphate dehydratase HisB n=1 Tax=Buchnera aphidicola TaxID=9 RepID=UPI002237F8D5|nr:bifunctional histidinol-phosphatase/imidazoleglycerol-phosphate dehydratase HisB [Buchnera aphidicola]MCW5197608.1 bifunctional histidinol-phosphatase/imidazoleglycerol-phosphate dehydratase HisB [Buchnera aphidicola (Chaitophorus viminalis)]
MNKKFIFLDRDGTLIKEPKFDCQIDSLKKFQLEPNVISVLLKLSKLNYKFIMITNQDGLGKTFSIHDFYLYHNLMLSIFSSQGIFFSDVLICPHFIQDNCVCRKPKFSLLRNWIINKKKKFMRKCFVIGDRESDMQLAKNIGAIGLKYERNNLNWNDIYNKIIYKNRFAYIHRKTLETNVYIKIFLDKKRKNFINTGIYFFNHMLEQISIHSNISFYIDAKGDIDIDDHHIVEDVAITLGKCLSKSLNKKKGINRYGFTLPMDESISSCILDISNRPYLNFQAKFKYQKVGDLSTEMIYHFFYSLVYSMKITLHLKSKGFNDHHCAESLFKSFGRALGQAIQINGFNIPSSKGVL